MRRRTSRKLDAVLKGRLVVFFLDAVAAAGPGPFRLPPRTRVEREFGATDDHRIRHVAIVLRIFQETAAVSRRDEKVLSLQRQLGNGRGFE